MLPSSDEVMIDHMLSAGDKEDTSAKGTYAPRNSEMCVIPKIKTSLLANSGIVTLMFMNMYCTLKIKLKAQQG